MIAAQVYAAVAGSKRLCCPRECRTTNPCHCRALVCANIYFLSIILCFCRKLYTTAGVAAFQSAFIALVTVPGVMATCTQELHPWELPEKTITTGYNAMVSASSLGGGVWLI